VTRAAIRPARRPPERGAALLVAMVGIAVITALAVDLAYESRVSLRIAANARDELRASYRARSGVALARLVLSFQQTLDDTAGAAAGLGAAMPRVQLWQLVPVGSKLADGLFGQPEPPAPRGDAGTPPAPAFEALIEDEATKVNVQLEGLAQTGDRRLWSQVQSLYQLVCDPRWDSLFDREDAAGVRTSREDLLVHLRDWVDDDRGDKSSGLVAASSGAPCAMVPAAVPFEETYSDENQPYDRGEDRYRAKNHRMDSLDELYLVAGIGDAFLAAFGDALTVYLPRDGAGAKRNVNVLEKRALLELAASLADPPLQPALLDPVFAANLQALVLERTAGGILSMTPQDLGQLIQLAGVTVNQGLLQASNQNSPFTDRSTTFRIRSSGSAGDVSTAIDAVVRMESGPKPQAGAPQVAPPQAAPGRLVHWREE
jgi:general secretion pathway protein K